MDGNYLEAKQQALSSNLGQLFTLIS